MSAPPRTGTPDRVPATTLRRSRTGTADRHGGPARRTGTADRHGGPARRTGTADRHGGPALASAAALSDPRPHNRRRRPGPARRRCRPTRRGATGTAGAPGPSAWAGSGGAARRLHCLPPAYPALAGATERRQRRRPPACRSRPAGTRRRAAGPARVPATTADRRGERAVSCANGTPAKPRGKVAHRAGTPAWIMPGPTGALHRRGNPAPAPRWPEPAHPAAGAPGTGIRHHGQPLASAAPCRFRRLRQAPPLRGCQWHAPVRRAAWAPVLHMGRRLVHRPVGTAAAPVRPPVSPTREVPARCPPPVPAPATASARCHQTWASAGAYRAYRGRTVQTRWPRDTARSRGRPRCRWYAGPTCDRTPAVASSRI